MIEILACAIKNLSRKRFRTFLTIAGIAIGVASVVLISTIGDVGKKVINDELDSLGIGSIM
ncbi:MAG: ABC transporter permease, partial [Oscillospiraceae bacterium]